MLTNDGNFPQTTKSKVLVNIWISLYEQALREMLYMASVAGIDSKLSYSEDNGQFLEFSCSSYNDAIEEYIGDAFKQMRTYDV